MSSESQPLLSGTELKRLIDEVVRLAPLAHITQGIIHPVQKEFAAARLALEEYVERRTLTDEQANQFLALLENPFGRDLNPIRVWLKSLRSLPSSRRVGNKDY